MVDLKIEIPRKLFHVFAGLLYLIPLFLCGKLCVAFLSAIATTVATFVFYFRIRNFFTYPLWFLINKLERKENLEHFPGRQAVAMNFGIFISSVLFSEKTLLAVIITLAVYDGFATIFGLLFGKHKIGYGKFKLKKTYEGLFGGLIANVLVLSLFFSLKEAFLFSAIAGIVEIFSNSKKLILDDNLLIPVLTGLFIEFIYPNLTF